MCDAIQHPGLLGRTRDGGYRRARRAASLAEIRARFGFLCAAARAHQPLLSMRAWFTSRAKVAGESAAE